jgi:GNAT superfamily N-acetyltransferase
MLPDNISVRVVSEPEMTVRLDAQIRSALCACFPNETKVFSHTRAWHGCAPAWTVVLVDAARNVLAHVGVVERIVSIGDYRFRMGGVQNVFVLPAHRGQGLVERILTATQAAMCAWKCDAGLLFCIPRLARVYHRTGWHILADREVVRINEAGEEVPLPPGNIVMWLPLVCDRLPTGRIHLNGNDW